MNPLYQIIKKGKLGSGTYGQVYECYYTADRTKYQPELCAVKCIESDHAGLKCVNELLIMSMFDHPNIMTAKQIYFENNEVMIVMPKAERSLLNYKADLSIIRNVIIDVLRALKVLHGAGFIHGDIKPDNILKIKNNYKLIDFSITATNVNKNRGTICTPNYRPPEAIGSHKSWDLKVDIWALGCTIFELVFGMLLFPSQDRPLRGVEYGLDSKLLNAIYDWARDTSQECAITFQNNISYQSYQYSNRFFNEPAFAKVADFIRQCCQINPAKRPTAHELLSHPFINQAPIEEQYAILQYSNITTLKPEALSLIMEYCVEYKLSNFYVEYLTKSVMITLALTDKFNSADVVKVMFLLMAKIFDLKLMNRFIETKLTTHHIALETLILIRLKYIMPIPKL